jgi:hypothetical protein
VAVGKVERRNLMKEIGDMDCELFASVFSRFDVFTSLVT